jgi:hypothetical protein
MSSSPRIGLSMPRPEGTALTRGQCATALVSVALAALAVGLGLAKRSWPIGAGLGGTSLLVAGIGCCHARRSVQVEPQRAQAVSDAPLQLGSVVIASVRGRLAYQDGVQVLIFTAGQSAVEGTQSAILSATAGREPFAEAATKCAALPQDRGGVVVTGSGMLAGVTRTFVHMVVPDGVQSDRLQEIYAEALLAAVDEGQSAAISLATVRGLSAPLNAEIAMSAIHNHAVGLSALAAVRIVTDDPTELQAVRAAIDARRPQAGAA